MAHYDGPMPELSCPPSLHHTFHHAADPALLALDLADHAYLLETGRVALSGPSDTIKNDESVRRAYLGY